MMKEEPGGHVILLYKVLFRAGFCITSRNGWGRTLGAGQRVLLPSVSPACFLDV